MEPKITFFNIGNGDTTLLQLKNEKIVLVDFADKQTDDPDDKKVDLPDELDKRIGDNDYDVVCFTHLDEDHIKGSTDYFYLEHNKKYQAKNRKVIEELWVPAAAITETNLKTDDARILQKEARFRFKNGMGIRVFSKPKSLTTWCNQNSIDIEKRNDLFVHAGTLVDTFTLENDGVEFFAHSPFVGSVDVGTLDRNEASISMQITFDNSLSSKVILGSDIDHDVWNDIVKITKHYKREARLEWDLFSISHHCSYLALSEEKGENTTIPDENIKWLFETQGSASSYIVSSCDPIPTKGSEEDSNSNPPYRQAANYYKSVVRKYNGGVEDRFLVTMQEPSKNKPEPLTLIIKNSGVALVKTTESIATTVGSSSPPRAGS